MVDVPVKPPAPVPPGAHLEKRRYERPEIIRYGSVAKLTQGARTANADSAMGGMMGFSCL
jgi:hypothetical protein